MKIPKNIDNLLKKRTKLVEELNNIEIQIDEWIENNGGDLCNPDINDAVTTGCMIICDPHSAENVIRDYIIEEM